MTNKTNYPRTYFDEDKDCLEHGEYKCSDCFKESKGIRTQSNALVAVSTNNQDYEIDPREEVEKFDNQLEFIKAGLEMSDEDLEKIKLVEIGKKFTEAKQSITVGNMKRLLGRKRAPRGVVKTVFTFLRKRI